MTKLVWSLTEGIFIAEIEVSKDSSDHCRFCVPRSSPSLTRAIEQWRELGPTLRANSCPLTVRILIYVKSKWVNDDKNVTTGFI